MMIHTKHSQRVKHTLLDGALRRWWPVWVLGMALAGGHGPVLAQGRATDQVFRLQPVDATAEDFNGDAVSVWGNRLLVGAPDDDDLGASSGSVYVYEYNGTAWVEVDKLTAPDGLAGDRFGDAVSLQGDRAVIGALLGDGLVADSGAVYVFEFDGLNWQFSAKLSADDGALSDHFGVAVDQDGDRILVGVDSDDDLGGQSGSAYLFELQTGSWVQLPKLTASDGAGIAQFGAAVSLAGDRALIGAPGDGEVDIVAGAGYIFERIGGVWQETAKLLAADGALGDALGSSAGLAGDRAALGAPGSGGTGAVYAYRFNGTSWTQDQRLVGSDLTVAEGQLFGSALALTGNQLLAGAPDADGLVNLSGAAYRYELVGGVWQEMDILNASDGASQDRLGASVSLFGSRYLVGADRADNEAGAAYVFQDVADLTLALSAPASVVAGTLLNYSLQVTNNGPSLARNGVLDHVLTPALTPDTISAPCAGGFPCALGDLATGASVTVDFSFSVPADSTGLINVQGMISSDTVAATVGDEAVDSDISITTEADVSVTKTGPASASSGEMVTYPIRVDNKGPSQAVGVTLSDNPVSGLTFVSAQAPCDTGFPCDLGTLDAGAAVTVDAVFQVMPGFTGTATNTASVSATTTDPNSLNDSDSADTLVDVIVDLAVDKQGPAQVTAGETVLYQLTVANLSAVDAPSTVLQDPTPPGLVFQSATAPCGSGFPCALGTVAGSSLVMVNVVYAVDSAVTGTVTNTATVTTAAQDSQPANDSISVQSQVLTSGDLALTVTGPASIAAGGQFTLDFMLTNNGPSDVLNARVLAPEPLSAFLISASEPCTSGFPCALGDLAAGASAMFSATFITNPGLVDDIDLSFNATSDTDDGNSANNSQTLLFNVDIVHDVLMFHKLNNTAHVEAGEITTYFIRVSNDGPSDAINIQLIDILPPELENASWTCNSVAGECQTANGTGDVDVLLNLPAGNGAEIVVTAQVSAAVQEGDVIINRATMTVPQGSSDPVPQNNSDADRDIVGLFADSFESDT